MGGLAVVAIVIAVVLLLGAVIYGVIRNNRAEGGPTSGSDTKNSSAPR
jgi:hypothetical protein